MDQNRKERKQNRSKGEEKERTMTRNRGQGHQNRRPRKQNRRQWNYDRRHKKRNRRPEETEAPGDKREFKAEEAQSKCEEAESKSRLWIVQRMRRVFSRIRCALSLDVTFVIQMVLGEFFSSSYSHGENGREIIYLYARQYDAVIEI
jgi:hypothetical protein